MHSRRSFIRNSGLLAFSPVMIKDLLTAISSLQLASVGIQLYMVREEMAKDPVATLKQLGKMGYTQIESYNGDKGIFWGYDNKTFNQIAKDNGLSLISSHYEGDVAGYEKTAVSAAEIGMKYLIYPWKGPQKSIDDFKKIAVEFNQYGAICKKNGLRFAYHPHDYPYKKIDGQLPIDVLLDNTDADSVDYEMDFYYTVTEGANPEAYIKKYKPRFRLSHIRDVMKVRLPAGSEEESATDLGKGIIDYKKLLSVCLENGMEYFFVEQSRYDHETPMQSAAFNLAYLKAL